MRREQEGNRNPVQKRVVCVPRRRTTRRPISDSGLEFETPAGLGRVMSALVGCCAMSQRGTVFVRFLQPTTLNYASIQRLLLNLSLKVNRSSSFPRGRSGCRGSNIVTCCVAHDSQEEEDGDKSHEASKDCSRGVLILRSCSVPKKPVKFREPYKTIFATT